MNEHSTIERYIIDESRDRFYKFITNIGGRIRYNHSGTFGDIPGYPTFYLEFNSPSTMNRIRLGEMISEFTTGEITLKGMGDSQNPQEDKRILEMIPLDTMKSFIFHPEHGGRYDIFWEFSGINEKEFYIYIYDGMKGDSHRLFQTSGKLTSGQWGNLSMNRWDQRQMIYEILYHRIMGNFKGIDLTISRYLGN